ncbi:MAG: site-specific integrase [Rhodospirillaceae bacterium]
MRVSDLTPAVLTAYEKTQGMKRATIRRELSVLAAAVVDATESGRLVGAPPIKLPPAPPGRTRHLNESEIGRLLAECRDDHLRLFVMLALNTGARRAAILDLTWPQIDFTTGVIDLNPPGRAQTQKKRPKVPMSPQLGDALRNAQETADSLYVVNWHGQPILSIKKALSAAAFRAGIAGVSAHVLRHIAGTLLAKAGVPLWMIGQLLGQSQIETTARYAHFCPEFGKEAVAILGRVTG